MRKAAAPRAQGRAALAARDTEGGRRRCRAWSFTGWLAGPDLDDAPSRRLPGAADKNRPNAANNRGRRVIAAQETGGGAVLKDALSATIGRGWPGHLLG